ncbi:MAG: TrmH family RNA methyltransferase, partial [Simkaniaceae bacterium]
MRRIIMGKHTVEEVFRTDPERLLKVYSYKKEDPFFRELENAGIKTVLVPKPKLASLVQSESHQGFVAEVRERTFLTTKEFLATAPEKSVVVLCDSINDPQNFGTILRACECFGVDALIFSKNRNVALTPVVSKASVGGSELVPLIEVSNLADTLKKFQDAGYFAVAAERSLESLYTFEFPLQTLLIVGAEGKGIQPLLSKIA